MKISDIRIQLVHIPLAIPFRTALREVTAMDNVLVTIVTDDGQQGYGSAAPATVITGETIASITGGVEHIRDCLIGMELQPYELLLGRLNSCLIGNNSAKAAVDIAIHDLLARSYSVPLHTFLGGPVREVETDITISLDAPDAMAAKSCERLAEGFTTLKIKVGNDPALDIERLIRINEQTAGKCGIRIDANQGWNAKEAVRVGEELERHGVEIELMEQPVPASDYEGLRHVRNNLPFPVYADESVFTPQNAQQLIEMRAVDGINIKLMKCGGIHNAVKIAAIAETAQIPCMIGSMMESAVSVTAAAHLAASRTIIGKFDLDSPLFCAVNPANGGLSYSGSTIVLPDSPGLGIGSLKSIEEVNSSIPS